MCSTVTVAIGPQLPEFGSWNWLGAGLIEHVTEPFVATTFDDIDSPPIADILVFLKFKPQTHALRTLREKGCRLVFMPVDVYGSTTEIEQDRESLRCFDLVVVHCRRLLRYFSAACRVEYLDHPLKYVLPEPRTQSLDGPLFWVGRSCNIRPVVEWANQQALTHELRVLTDTDSSPLNPRTMGFDKPGAVRIATWTPDLHFEWLAQAGAAIDVKGLDFRSRHKPVAKAFDFLASGVPVLVNRGSSAAMELSTRGITPLFAEDFNRSSANCSRSEIKKNQHAVAATASPEFVWPRTQELLRTLCDRQS